MAEEPIDGQAGWHRQVAADAFNRAWELIELDTRTPEQDRQLLALVFTSRYHWGWVGGDEEAMVGDWLIAHVASLQDLGELSHRYATVALDVVPVERVDRLAPRVDARGHGACVGGGR